MTFRAVASLALFTLLPVVSASAQFTAYVPPPAPKPADTVQAIVATGRAPGDTTSRVAITNMKAWVDSAAGVVAGRHLTSTDSVVPTTPGGPGTPTTFRDGSSAPDTATPLPTLALLGASALGAGLFLLRGRRA